MTPGELCGAYMPQHGDRYATTCVRRAGHPPPRHWSTRTMQARRRAVLAYYDRLRAARGPVPPQPRDAHGRFMAVTS